MPDISRRTLTQEATPPPQGFAGLLASSARSRLRTLGVPTTYRPGDFLLRQGDRSNYVLILMRGRVKITSIARNGYEAVLAIRGPGDLIGEMSGLNNRPRSSTAIALDTVDARVIDGREFRAFVDSEAGAGLALAELISSKLRAANQRRLEFAAFPVRRRLAQVLADLEKWHGVISPDGNRMDIDLTLSQADLAGLTGSSLEAAAKAIRELSRCRIIATRRRHVAILDSGALRRLAVGD